MSANLSALIPELQPFARELVRAAGAAGLQPRITSTLRSHTEQVRLYRRFLAGAAQYPVAPPGTSAHEYGYAFDMVVSPLDELEYSVAPYWKSLGGLWNRSDAVHFEYPGFREDLASGNLEIPRAYGFDKLAAEAAGFVIPPLGVIQTVADVFPENVALQQAALPPAEGGTPTDFGYRAGVATREWLKRLFTF